MFISQLKLALFPHQQGWFRQLKFHVGWDYKKTQAFRGKTIVLEALTFINYGRKGPLVSLTYVYIYICYCSLFLVVKSQLSWFHQVSFKDSNSGSFAKWISAWVVKRRQCHFLELVDLWFTLWSICDLNVSFLFPGSTSASNVATILFIGGLRFFFFRSDSQVACCRPKMHQIWSRPYPKRSILLAR